MKHLYLVLLIFLAPANALAKDCSFELVVVKGMSFGSLEQLNFLKENVKKGCSFLVLKYQRPNNKALLILDLNSKMLFRWHDRTSGISWESWRNFTKQQFMADDPSDGFDSPNYESSRTNQQPTGKNLSAKMLKALKANR